MKPLLGFTTFLALIFVIMSMVTGEDFWTTFWYLVLLFISMICLAYTE